VLHRWADLVEARGESLARLEAAGSGIEGYLKQKAVWVNYA
jgi:hypothetical protein